MLIKVSLVLPFYNELENLKILIPNLIKNIKSIDIFFEIILINDNSNDGSLNFCKTLKIKDYNYKIIIIDLTKRSGQTGAFKEAFKIATGEYIIRMDSDLQDQPEDLHLFIEKIYHKYDLIIGHRKKRHHNLLLTTLSILYDQIIKVLIKSSLSTHTSSFIAFKAKYLKKLPWYKNDHRYLPIIVILRGAKKNCNVEIHHKHRLYGISKYNTFFKIFAGIPEIILLIIRVIRKKYN